MNYRIAASQKQHAILVAALLLNRKTVQAIQLATYSPKPPSAKVVAAFGPIPESQWVIEFTLSEETRLDLVNALSVEAIINLFSGFTEEHFGNAEAPILLAMLEQLPDAERNYQGEGELLHGFTL